MSSEGNVIGTNAVGLFALPNVDDGISVSTSGDTIGGTAAGAGQLDFRHLGCRRSPGRT